MLRLIQVSLLLFPLISPYVSRFFRDAEPVGGVQGTAGRIRMTGEVEVSVIRGKPWGMGMDLFIVLARPGREKISSFSSVML